LSTITSLASISEPGLEEEQQQSLGHRVPIEKLNHMNPSIKNEFWTGVSRRNSGNWLKDVLCTQQLEHYQESRNRNNKHNNNRTMTTMLGFPWMTLGNVVENSKAVKAMELIASYPKESIKVVRYRRNLLDTLTRQAQQVLEDQQQQQQQQHGGVRGSTTNNNNIIKTNNKEIVRTVVLPHKTILKELPQWQKEQEALDKYLLDTNIPHIVVDHEVLFPFNDWKELINVTELVEEFPMPLNVHIDYTRVPPDQRPPDPSPMEQEWGKLLQYLHLTRPPIALHDLFVASNSYERKNDVFWTQQQSITNYASVQAKLTGTRYQSLLRNLVYKHDFYGCACNDKEANKVKLWRGWKDHHNQSNSNENTTWTV